MRASPIEILLVEDNEDDVVLAREAFDESRLLNIVHVVRDGEQALAYLRREGEFADRHLPGLVLLDINMPRKNGFEVLDEVKSDPALKYLPMVMLTVSDREEDVVKSYAGGAVSYIRKPVTFDQLRMIVHKFELYWTVVSRLPNPHG